MVSAPIPNNEAERQVVVESFGILDTDPEERFDHITKAATEKLKAPISTVSIIDKDREWYKSCVGVQAKEGKRDVSFCGHTSSFSCKYFRISHMSSCCSHCCYIFLDKFIESSPSTSNFDQ
jgi:hypothetical protein